MLIPFCSNTRGSGAGLAQGFGEKYYPQGWRFFRQTEGIDLGKATIPRTTFADKKGTARLATSHIVEPWKRSESATLEMENKKGGYLQKAR